MSCSVLQPVQRPQGSIEIRAVTRKPVPCVESSPIPYLGVLFAERTVQYSGVVPIGEITYGCSTEATEDDDDVIVLSSLAVWDTHSIWD